MDRNGKKPKAAPHAGSLNAQRSDMKASARDILGRTDAPRAQGGKGPVITQGGPTSPGRKGRRG